jgi:L-alanine-DL-glutamate epimerase-like enolase superfamily enzyme
LMAALLHAHYPCEYNGPHGVQDIIFSRPVTPVRGKFILTDVPGLGLEIVEAELQKRMMPWR